MRAIVAMFFLALAAVAPVQAQTYVNQYKTIIPHIAYGAGWQNRFVVANYNAQRMRFQLSFYGNDGTALALPLKSFGTYSTIDRYVNEMAMEVIETETPGDTLSEGYAIVTLECPGPVCADVSVYGVFATVQTATYPVFEASVMASDSRATKVVLPYYNKNSFITGIAVAAHTCTGSSHAFRMKITDSDEFPTATHDFSFTMSCPGHKSFALPTEVSFTAGKRGVVLIDDANSGAQLSAVGILFNPNGGAHTTLPVSEAISGLK